MEKKIDQLVLLLKIVFFGWWSIVIILYILGKCGYLSLEGMVEPKSQMEYMLETFCYALVIVSIPLAMKLFSICTTKNMKQKSPEQALETYKKWGIIRLVIISLAGVSAEILYFASYNMSCGVCTLIAMTATLLCYPSKVKVQDYLDTLSNE